MQENKQKQKKKELINYLTLSKYDLEDKISDLFNFRQKYYLKYKNLNIDEDTHPYIDLQVLVNEMITSYTAPAYHYNLYIDNLILDLTNDDNKNNYGAEEIKDSSALRRVKYQADAHSILLSIKMALDRMVTIFSYYIKGFSRETTFGRQKINGKYSGFMSRVNDLKDKDDLMKYIDNCYELWIKFAVSPRDMITHNNDLAITYSFDSETGCLIPIHGNVKIFSRDNENSSGFGQYSFHDYTNKWYEFFEIIINDLLSRDLVITQGKI